MISSTSPLAINRPLPPKRSKRHSSISPSPSPSITDLCHTLHLEDKLGGGLGGLGGLREKSQDELRGATRESLMSALQDCWIDHERLKSHYEETAGRLVIVEEEKMCLEGMIGSLQARYEEALDEQNRLEADLEGRDEVLDHLRARLQETERTLREVTKRASEQEKSFEQERRTYETQEFNLQQRIQSLLSKSASLSTTTKEHEMEEEITDLKLNCSSLMIRLESFQREIGDLKSMNQSLKEENEGGEFLCRQRTLSGRVKNEGFLSRSRDQSSPRMDERRMEKSGQLDILDEELEMEMEELNSDLEAQSPILEQGLDFVKDLDDDEDQRDPSLSRSPESIHLKLPTGRRRVRKSVDAVAEAGQCHSDLAAELGRADVHEQGGHGQKDEMEALRAEMKSLKEENKALTLYCSKIIDRIIAQEGFEHVLSVDYKTRRMGRSTSGSNRGSLKDITGSMQSGQPQVDAVKVKEKGRPMSMIGRAMSGHVEKVSPVPTTEKVEKLEAKEVKEAKSEKRARRGFSLDFRALGFGSSTPAPTPTPTEPKPPLKPLTLSAKSTPVILPKPFGRRLEKEEEDEEDKKERHRLEASLKLMGVERTSQGSDRSIRSSRDTGRKLVKPDNRVIQEETESLIPPVETRTSSRKSSTPLSRLSSALSPERPTLPLSPDIVGSEVSLEIAAQAALKAFDQREKEQVVALSKGKNSGIYTSPSGTRRVSGKRGSGDDYFGLVKGDNVGASPNKDSSSPAPAQVPKQGEVGRRMAESTSISTLWSMGSSRPNSQEITGQVGP